MKEEKLLMRSGHRNTLKSQRILLYHMVSNNDISNCKSVDDMNEIVSKAFKDEEYYVLKVSNEDKYLHIEKDGSILFTDFPICYIQKEIFDNEDYVIEIGEFILNQVKQLKQKCGYELNMVPYETLLNVTYKQSVYGNC